MNTQIVFTLGDLGWFVIWGLLVVILFYIVLILIRLYRSFRQLMKIVDDNRENINKVLDEAPGITQNINEISGEVSHAAQAFRGTVDNIATTSNAATGKIVENNDIVSQITLIFKVLGTIKEGVDKVLGKTQKDEPPVSTNEEVSVNSQNIPTQQ